MSELVTTTHGPRERFSVRFLCFLLFTSICLSGQVFAHADSLEVSLCDGQEKEGSPCDPTNQDVTPPSYIVVSTTTSGFLSRTTLQPTARDGYLEGFEIPRPVLAFPDIAIVEDPKDVAKKAGQLEGLPSATVEYIKVSDSPRMVLTRKGLCLKEFDSASVHVEQIHEFAGRHLLTLGFPRAQSFAGSSDTVQKLVAESITDVSMDPSGWERRSDAYLVCLDKYQFPKMWPERKAVSFPEFKEGSWRKRVKVLEVVPFSVAGEKSTHSYNLLLTLSVTVPWVEETHRRSSGSVSYAHGDGHDDFDMEIFKREEDNLQVEKFLFEIKLVVKKPYHFAVAVGLLHGAVCMLSRERDAEPIDFSCPVFDRLWKRLQTLREQETKIKKRAKAHSILASAAAGAAALGIWSIIWGLTQPRKLRKRLDNTLPQLLEYQFKLAQQTALSDVSLMVRPTNMMTMWSTRHRNPRAAAGGIAEGVGFWTFLSGLVGTSAAMVNKVTTVDVEEKANKRIKASLGQRLAAAAASAVTLFRKGTPSVLRILFIVSDDFQ
ncbi:hypothetical protein BESB_084350 [Besnoitia besnoiti]|uniref:Transmembrane protein n=1 Tax=Besnoitia besnoiti TaxID=94643 RepID=A0A2A9MBD7_BESBE|nr:hypothetical protein BESB_084350 [Besnoitia besnoiti]PFH33236.1 hypothetical protein BESB_084350 [Besnoitia besnoiti]